MWYIGDEDGGCGLTHVPIQVDKRAVRFREIVIPVEDRGEDDQQTEGEDAAKNNFSFRGQAGFDEDGKGDIDHHKVGGDVEDGRGDEMVVVGCTLRWNQCQRGPRPF